MEHPDSHSPLYLVLPNIRSCHNVGAMFRCADAFGFLKLYLVGYTAHPPKVQIDKVSLGAEKWVAWEKRDDLIELIDTLRSDNVCIVGLEMNEESTAIEDRLSQIAHDAQAGAGVALIVGNEVDGLSEEVLSHCDYTVHIPMKGQKESLNVSIAAGIAMYTMSQWLADGQKDS
jgi:23S rRNA (guanosine2251-2'-O)-methyltransferase